MRNTLDIFLSKYNNPDLYFMHADMWGFPAFKKAHPTRCMNFGIQETNMMNVAGGMARCGKHVIIYGVAGFVYQRGYEQLKFSVVNYGNNVTLVNAGHNKCYERCGIGHLPDDDMDLMNALSIPVFEPPTRGKFLHTLTTCLRSGGVNFIRLGWDGCEW